MSVFDNLKPEPVWRYFEEITRIPRPSGKEEKMIAYISDFASKNSLGIRKDSVGNIVIRKEARKGFEKKKSVCLQSHLDMVCEKTSESRHNFEQDPIPVYVEEGWVKSRGTTLGADNGIGVAASLAVMADSGIKHGPLECLFTVDEETGLVGANGLETGFIDSTILLNLDSEDDGELFIGCAGGVMTNAIIEYETRNTPEGCAAYSISVSGLLGGHSGTDIHKNRGNSIKLLNLILWEIRNRFGARLSLFEGGNLHNAIPREAKAVVVVPADYTEVFLSYIQDYYRLIRREFAVDEPDLRINIVQVPDIPEKVMKKKAQEKLLNAIYVCPNGVISWSRVMENLVETSTNLASIKFIEGNKILITTSQRSSSDAARQLVANSVESSFRLAGAVIEHTSAYPGWKPNPASEILGVTVECYESLFAKKPDVKAVHAGLECGLFLEKYPYLDMVSFGPTIVDPHSPSERLNIETTAKFWDLLIKVLEKIPEA
jgi:dipeptidase D